jgi:MFS family permease
VVSLLVAGFADETVAFLPFGALEPLRRDLGLTYAQGSVLLALYPGIGVLATGFGVLADRWNRRVLAAGGAFGYAAGLLLFAAGQSYAMLVAGIALMGFAGDAMVRATDVALVDVAGDKIELAVARTTLLGTLGDLAGPALLAACLSTGLGWRPAFLVGGVGMAAYGALLASQPLPRPRSRRKAGLAVDIPPIGGTTTASSVGGRPAGRGTVVDVVRDRRVLGLGLRAALLDVFDEPFLAFAVAYLISARGQPAGVATLAAGAAAVGAALNLAWIPIEARFLTLRPGQAGTTSAVVSAVGQVAIAVPLVAGRLADGAGVGPALLLYLGLAAAFAGFNRRPLPAGDPAPALT